MLTLPEKGGILTLLNPGPETGGGIPTLKIEGLCKASLCTYVTPAWIVLAKPFPFSIEKCGRSTRIG